MILLNNYYPAVARLLPSAQSCSSNTLAMFSNLQSRPGFKSMCKSLFILLLDANYLTRNQINISQQYNIFKSWGFLGCEPT